MIDPPTSAQNVSSSQLKAAETFQSLGWKMTQVFGAELSRLRASSEYSATAAAHVPETQRETLRAIHSSALGRMNLSLSLLPGSLYTNTTGKSEQGDGLSVEVDNASSLLAQHLSQALERFKIACLEHGESGEPIAFVIPGDRWIDRSSPANIRAAVASQARTAQADSIGTLLVFCLAFEGSIGHSRRLTGLLFHGDQCLASFHGVWSEEALYGQENIVRVQTRNTSGLVSPIEVEGGCGCTFGIRVKLDSAPVEPDCWYWVQEAWEWH